MAVRGTRNYIGILSSVNCSATVADYIADEVDALGHPRGLSEHRWRGALHHGTGCGMGSKGEEFDILARTQWGYATHPNFAAVLVIGLAVRCSRSRASRGLWHRRRRAFPEPDDHESGRHPQVRGGRRRAGEGDARLRQFLRRQTVRHPS